MSFLTVLGLLAGVAVRSAAAVEIAPETAEIVVATNAAPTVRFAAQEMNDVFVRMFGRALPVVATPTSGRVAVILGDGALARAAGIDVAALKRDAFVIKAAGDRIFVAGRDDARVDPAQRIADSQLNRLEFERATLFGAYELLERFGGVRFYFPGELGTVVPKRASLTVPEGTLERAPAFLVRNPYLSGDGGVPGDGWTGGWDSMKYGNDVPKEVRRIRDRWKTLDWLRLRLQTESIPCCHGQRGFSYPSRFHETHPEYFTLSKQKDGSLKRDAAATFYNEWRPQLCQSSAVWDEFFLDAKAYFADEKPATRGRTGWGSNFKAKKYIDVMPNDGYERCFCAACAAAYEDGRADGQYATELIWSRTAAFAKRLTDAGIDAIVTQMAYWPYQALPKCDLPPNVYVMVADAGPWSYANAPEFEKSVAMVKSWAEKLGHKVWMWTYPSKWGRKACPGVPDMAPRTWFRTYKAYAPYSLGSFCESECDKSLYHYLNYYVFSKLAWDESLDLEALLAEHFELMFGAAASEMATFYRELEERWTKRVLRLGASSAVGRQMIVANEDMLWAEIYGPDVMKMFADLFDRGAAKLAAESEEAKRLAFIRAEFLGPMEEKSAAYVALTKPSFDDINQVGNLLKEIGAGTMVLTNSTRDAKGVLNATGPRIFFREPLKPNTEYCLAFDFRIDIEDPDGSFWVDLYFGKCFWFPRENQPRGHLPWTHREFVFKTPETVREVWAQNVRPVLRGKGRAEFRNLVVFPK